MQCDYANKTGTKQATTPRFLVNADNQAGNENQHLGRISLVRSRNHKELRVSNIPEITAAGEYAATTIELTRDGSSVRLAFGRKGEFGPVYHGAAILTVEAVQELKDKLLGLGV